MRTKDLKSSKGITLIALVVTIIILLILLATAVTSITGRKGVIGQAQDAKTASEIEDIRENITLAYVQAEGKKRTVNEDLSPKIKEELDKDYDSGNTSVSKEDSGEYTVIVNGKTFIINSRDKVLTEEEISEASENIYVTLYSDGTLAFDNNPNTIVGKELESGTQTWNITGQNYGFENSNFPPWIKGGFAQKVKEVDFLNKVLPTSTSTWFLGCSNLTSIKHIANLNTRNVTNMSGMFETCSNLTNLDISSFNTSNVTDMSFMFTYCEALETLNLGSLNTSNVTTMYEMFESCKKLKNIDVSSFDTKKVTDMREMFEGCKVLENIDISNFEIKSDCDFSHLAANCTNLKNIYADKSNFEDIDKVRSINETSDGANVCTSKKNNEVFGYEFKKGLGWVSADTYFYNSSTPSRAVSSILRLDKDKRYSLKFNCSDIFYMLYKIDENGNVTKNGWSQSSNIEITGNSAIAFGFKYQSAGTEEITDEMVETIKNGLEIKVVE